MIKMSPTPPLAHLSPVHLHTRKPLSLASNTLDVNISKTQAVFVQVVAISANIF